MKHQSPVKKIAVVLLGMLPILLCIAVIAAITLPVVLTPSSGSARPVQQAHATENDRSVTLHSDNETIAKSGISR